MKEAKIGDNVKVHYTGKIKDGEVFDSSREREPFEFVLGENQVIKGFEEAVLGMGIGDTVNIEISPEEGYGPKVEEMVQTLPTDNLPEGVEVGMKVRGTGPMGQPVIATVLEINESADFTDANGTTHNNISVTKLDFNHPLAGETLEFEIQLLELAKPNNTESSES